MDPVTTDTNSSADAAPAPSPTRMYGPISSCPAFQRLEADHRSLPQPSGFGLKTRAAAINGSLQRMTYGSNPRKRARLIALASSRCFLADTAVMRLGTILPRSDT